jgi:hypothetical protein
MKSFVNYLTESKKTYEFKIKVAGDLGEEYKEMLRTAMEKFSVVKMSNGKRTPIQEVPLDFPQLKNTQVTVFDVEVNYPTTPEVLENYLAQVCGYPLSSFRVVTANAASEAYQEEIAAKKEKTDPLLVSEYDKEDNQDLVGEKRISSFLKDLANDAKDRAVKNQPTEKASPMPEADAGISPIGSKAQKGK